MPEPGAVRRERLGVNLFDATDLPAGVSDRVGLARKLELDKRLHVRLPGDESDGVVVPFACPLLVAAAALDFIRAVDRRAGGKVTRAYLRRLTAWERLPADAVLTMPGPGGLAVLSPRWFPPPAVAVTVAAAPLTNGAVTGVRARRAELK